MEISIHALRKESDPARQWRRAGVGISIHALRKESDVPIGVGAGFFLFYFNPRSP